MRHSFGPGSLFTCRPPNAHVHVTQALIVNPHPRNPTGTYVEDEVTVVDGEAVLLLSLEKLPQKTSENTGKSWRVLFLYKGTVIEDTFSVLDKDETPDREMHDLDDEDVLLLFWSPSILVI